MSFEPLKSSVGMEQLLFRFSQMWSTDNGGGESENGDVFAPLLGT